MIEAAVTALLLLSLGADVGDAGAAPPLVPGGAPWESKLVVFPPASSPEQEPWRTDPRLAGRFHSTEAPDDVEVFFDGPDRDPDRLNEVMWVTVIGYDPATDQFLGVLINTPFFIKTVQNGDNVVFKVVPGARRPVAQGGPGFGMAGYPRKPTPFLSTVAAGVRAYRLGRFGHNMPGIEKCIEVLRPALTVEPPAASAHDRQVAHFVLARCLAEKYETREAIGHFERAVQLDPRDPHAQMGLIAELSVMVHTPAKQAPEGAEFWEARMVTEIDRMQTRFPDETKALKSLEIIRSDVQARPGMSDAELAFGHRVGFGVLRYKVR